MAGNKRSAAVALSLIGAYIGVNYYLGHYQRDDTVPADLFTSTQQCASSGRYDRPQCDNAYAQAAQVQQQTAPRYASIADCEADFSRGACDRVPPVSAVTVATASPAQFAPVRAGVVIGGAAAAFATPAAQPVYRSCAASPDRNDCGSGYGGGSGGGGRYFTGAGYRVSAAGSGSSVSISRSAFSASAPSATLSRGGFGARAASMSARA
ncbi:MAG TPA: DUF1190 domain-containing protein [Stellaceae bacterium]|nr:DUF1190 domain-containing protein [Stellaceae bacterium]